MIKKFVNNCDEVVFKVVNISPSDASYLIKEYFNNEGERSLTYYRSVKSKSKIDKYEKLYRDGKWLDHEKFNSEKSVLIFFRDDHYQSFYEGKHRLIALSRLEDNIEIGFLCALGWPGSLSDFRKLVNKGRTRENKKCNRSYFTIIRKMLHKDYSSGKFHTIKM